MKFFNIDVPAGKYWLAKDLVTIIYNIERKQYPKTTYSEYTQLLEKKIKENYKAAKGTKTLIDVLKDYRKSLRKKEDN